MFSWIPLIGPIIDGVVHIFSKYQDTVLGKYKVDGTVDIEAMKASANIIQATKDDIGLRILRDAVCLPVVVWTMIIGWDTIVVRHNPELVYVVEKYPASVEYLPYAVIMFLLGNIGINAWKRR